MAESILKVEQVSLAFGGVKALTDVSFEVPRGSVFSIIGPNGAGKTSMLNCISGRYRPNSGNIIFNDQNVTKSTCQMIGQILVWGVPFKT